MAGRPMSMREMCRGKLDPSRRRRGASNPDPGEGPPLASEDAFDDGALFVDQGDGMHVASGRYEPEPLEALPDAPPPGWGDPSW